jgi:hypothetical protein
MLQFAGLGGIMFLTTNNAALPNGGAVFAGARSIGGF